MEAGASKAQLDPTGVLPVPRLLVFGVSFAGGEGHPRHTLPW